MLTADTLTSCEHGCVYMKCKKPSLRAFNIYYQPLWINYVFFLDPPKPLMNSQVM